MRTARVASRPSGIQPVRELPWGSHFAVFHASPRELLDVLVPFITAGLQGNELCSWHVEAPLTVEEVTRALASALPDLDAYVAAGQVEIVPAIGDGAATPPVEERIERLLDRATLAGFDGLRLVHQPSGGGGTPGLAVAETIDRLNVVAAVPYPRSELGVVELMERVQDHRFALVCNSGCWEVLQGSGARTAHEALRRSEDKLESLFRNMSEGFAYHRIVRDARGTPCDYVFLEVNSAFERLTGIAARDILGKRVTQVLPGIEADPVDWIGKCGRVALTGEPVRFESHVAALDRWFAVSAFSSQEGYFAVTFADITERRRADARFKLLSDSATLLLSTHDPQAIVSEVCHEVMEHLECHAFFNFLADPLAGDLYLNAWSGIPDEEARKIERLGYGVAVCGCVARDKQPIVAEDISCSADRRLDLVRSYGVQAYCCHPLIAEGRLVGTLSFGTKTRSRFSDEDVVLMKTVADQVAVAMERIQAQRALQEANQRLQEADRRKDEFLGVLSHELRNPLAPIRNAVYVLRNAQPGSEQTRRAQSIIERQAEHLTRLVDDLLDVTRITRGKIELRRSPIDLREIVSRTAEDFRLLLDDRGITFRTALPHASTWADADPTRITQVLGNLLHNAAKFTSSGDEVTLSLQVAGPDAEIRVRDTGAGIDPALLPHVFDPFVQGERTLARTEGGLGLGLALVKGITELHGGTVHARSAGEGRGAEFVVRLPLTEELMADERRRATFPARAEHRKVLVVDDNVDAAESLAEIVRMLGHAAEVAFDGPSAIAKARTNPPSLVLCDIGLPGMSGYEVARTLRAGATNGMQLIALSGYAQAEDVRRALDAGFDGHIAKPCDPEQIERLLE